MPQWYIYLVTSHVFSLGLVGGGGSVGGGYWGRGRGCGGKVYQDFSPWLKKKTTVQGHLFIQEESAYKFWWILTNFQNWEEIHSYCTPSCMDTFKHVLSVSFLICRTIILHSCLVFCIMHKLRIGSCLACVYRVMDARGKLGEHERSVRVARGAPPPTPTRPYPPWRIHAFSAWDWTRVCPISSSFWPFHLVFSAFFFHYRVWAPCDQLCLIWLKKSKVFGQNKLRTSVLCWRDSLVHG